MDIGFSKILSPENKPYLFCFCRVLFSLSYCFYFCYIESIHLKRHESIQIGAFWFQWLILEYHNNDKTPDILVGNFQNLSHAMSELDYDIFTYKDIIFISIWGDHWFDINFSWQLPWVNLIVYTMFAIRASILNAWAIL